MQQAAPPQPRQQANLTPRELDVLNLIAQGQTTAEIALNLAIANSTVKTHVRNLKKKLAASNRAEAVAHALQQGLLKPE